MSYQFAISPDVHNRDLTSWFILNTRIQRITGQPFHPTLFDDFGDLHRAYEAGQVDLVFANAADTALLVRRHGYRPVAGPIGVADEAAVVVAAESPVRAFDQLPAPFPVAATDAPDVERICRILLEPSDLDRSQIPVEVKRNYVLVAKALMTGQSAGGFFLRTAYDQLSEVIRSRLRILISSQIYVVRHCLLAAPAIGSLIEPLLDGLRAMSDRPADAELLAELGAPHGWEPTSVEQVEFMIDLMDALER
jgi:phosphonate transport system substrate-binding protein